MRIARMAQIVRIHEIPILKNCRIEAFDVGGETDCVSLLSALIYAYSHSRKSDT